MRAVLVALVMMVVLGCSGVVMAVGPVVKGVTPEAVVRWMPGGSWVVSGGEAGRVGYERLGVVEGSPAGVGSVVRLDVPGGMVQAWSVGLASPTEVAVAEGDRLLARVWMRTLDSMTGEGFARFGFERAGPDHDKSVYVEFAAGREWQLFEIAFEAHDGFAAGAAQAVLHLGFDVQAVEVGLVEVYSYGRGVEVDDLPSLDLSYAGREADAAWRVEAMERIERIRKGDVTVVVLDGTGAVVEGAEVSIELRRHAFPFGTAVALPGLLGESEDDVRYREVLKRYFNYAVFENAMKWNNHGIGTPEEIDRGLSWLASNGIPVRGHVLVWPGWRTLPGWLRELESDPEALRRAVAERITSTVARYRGQITDWDVMNEPVVNYDLMEILGYGVMTEWFKLAELTSPETPRYINDYAILTAGRHVTGHQRRYYEIIETMLAEGAPIDGIGLQGHFGTNQTSPERVLEILDWFGSFGLPIRVTELDINTRDRALQADYMRDFMIAAFSHPSVNGILIWGFWENRVWRPECALFNADWTVRPHGQAWIDLVHGAWKTHERGVTDDHGAVSFRGFYGDYGVVVESGGVRVAGEFTLTGSGDGVVEVVIE